MTARRLLGWWVALFGLWFVLVGGWTRLAAVWGAGLALVAAVGGAVVTRQGRFRGRLRGRWLAELASAATSAASDTVLVATELARCVAARRRQRGSFARDRSAAGDDAEAVGRRAWVELVATWSPDSYVIDVDPETGERLRHDLVPRHASGSPS